MANIKKTRSENEARVAKLLAELGRELRAIDPELNYFTAFYFLNDGYMHFNNDASREPETDLYAYGDFDLTTGEPISLTSREIQRD